jgi:site-specific recombinase XerD
LGLDKVNTHSVRKAAGIALYESTGCNIEMVREFYQHSSVAITQAYIKTTSGAMQKALNSIVDLG